MAISDNTKATVAMIVMIVCIAIALFAGYMASRGTP